VVHNFLK